MRLEAKKYLYDIQQAAGLIDSFTAAKTVDGSWDAATMGNRRAVKRPNGTTVG